MTGDSPLLAAAAEKAASAYSAVCHEAHDGRPDLATFRRLLADDKLGFTAEERSAIRRAPGHRLAAEIWAVVIRRRGEGCWPWGKPDWTAPQ